MSSKNGQTRTAQAAHLRGDEATNEVITPPRNGPSQIMSDSARDQMRRELAAWLQAVRARAIELRDEVKKIARSCSDGESLLFELIDPGHLTSLEEAGRDLDSADTNLLGVIVRCPIPDVLAIARNYRDSWGV